MLVSVCFSSLLIYTTLKLDISRVEDLESFSSLLIYTTLKRLKREEAARIGFSSLLIYTTLKLYAVSSSIGIVLVPY